MYLEEYNMDIVQKILSKKNYEFKVEKFNSQTWEDFNNFKKNKVVFVFGAGEGAEYYFKKYGESVYGIIDNDDEKQKLPIDFFIDKIVMDRCQEKKVLDISILKKYKNEDIVVLIANLKSCEEIAEQLERLEIANYFSLLAMEKLRLESSRTLQQYTADSITTECTKKIDPNKVVFYNTGGYFGHGKYIAEQLLKFREDLDIVWIVDDMNLYAHVPKGIRLVYGKNPKKYMPELETAKVWIYDNMVPLHYKKKKEQIYIQVKHWPSITLKTFGFDFFNFRKEDEQVEICKYNSEIIDYIITGSKFDTETCRSGFLFKGEVIQVGSPRSDILFNESGSKEKVCESLGVKNHKKILLYAPTFRCKRGVYFKPEFYETNLDYELLLKNLTSRFSGDWNIILRLHPIVAEASKNIKLPEYVIDASDYNDSQELVAAADILITDYSSIMFEPAFVRKPVFLFAPDKKEYINGERKLLIDYDSLPFPIAESNDELAKNIKTYNKEEYVRKVDEFLKKYGVHEDGHASERAAKFILDLIDGKRS